MSDAVLIAEAPTSAQTLPAEPAAHDVGDWVHLVFWRPSWNRWESASARVVSAGIAQVCVEVTSASTDPDGANSATSLIRWAPHARVFRHLENATAACRSLPAPATA